jgi:hypothetical protein
MEKDKVFRFRLSRQERERLTLLAALSGRSRSAVLRGLLSKAALTTTVSQHGIGLTSPTDRPA